MNPTTEQVAWATMVIGLLNQENDDNAAVQAWRRTMLLAQLLSARETRR